MTFSAIETYPSARSSIDELGEVRILHVIEATLGGTLRYLENMTAALTPSPIKFGLAYATRRADHRLQPTLDLARRLGWKLFPVDMRREVHQISDVACAYSLTGAIRQFRPQILHCHSSKAGALGRIASCGVWPRPRVIYSPHALALAPYYLRIERTFRHLTHRFLAVSDSERDQLLELGLGDESSVGVVYPTIDTQIFAPRNQQADRSSLSLPNGPMLLGIGRMTHQKRPLDFLKILRLVRAEIPETVGVWLGDGEHRALFEEKAREFDLALHVRVTGWVKDVRPYIGAASVVLSTSAFESFGYVVPEALSMERPVVATRVCGTTDVLPSTLGDVFFEVGDTENAARKCVTILSSRAVWEKLGKDGRRFVISRFSQQRMRDALLQFYSETITPALIERRA